jgi:hypothetical protein
MPHIFCFLRPEGPSVNRPGREAGIGRINKMSTEGAAQLHMQKMAMFLFLIFAECRAFSAHWELPVIPA